MNYICEYDESYTKSDAEDIGFCGRCRIPTCENSMVSNNTYLKEKMISALEKQICTRNVIPKRKIKLV